jgi:uncharacterized protein YifE (UPF0438 family)
MRDYKELKELCEAKRGLYANIHAKRKRGEAPAKPGSEDYPAKDAFKKAARTAKESIELGNAYTLEEEKDEKRFCKLCQKPETRDECSYGPKAWDRFSSPIRSVKREETELDEAAWTRKSGQNKEGGLNEKGRKSYERENPGSDLKAPSKKVGNPRRASFCARMKGLKKKLTSKKTAKDPDSRVNKSLRQWNC